MTSINGLFGSLKTFMTPNAANQTQQAAAAAAAPTMARDAFTGTAAMTEGGRELGQALAGINAAYNQDLMQARSLAAEAGGNVTQQRLTQIDLQLTALKGHMEGLAAFKQLGQDVARNPDATAVNKSTMAAILREGAGNASTQRNAALLTSAEDVARNAGADVPSDRGLYNATQQLTGAIANRQDQYNQLAQEAAGNVSQQRLAQIQLQMGALADEMGRLKGLKGQADKLADNPDASPEATQQMSALLAEASGNTSTVRQEQLVARAKDLVRGENGQAVDPALSNATMGLATKRGQLEDDVARLTQEAGGNVTQMRLAQLQLQIDEDRRQLGTLDALQGQADKLADKANASPENRQQMAALLTEATGNASGTRQAQILTAAQDLARNAGRVVPSDRGLANAISQLADRQAQLNDDMGALTKEAASNVSQMRLTQAQLQIDDDKRQADGLGQLRAEADRLADRRTTTPDQAAQMSALLAEASGNISQQRLYQLIAAAQQIGR